MTVVKISLAQMQEELDDLLPVAQGIFGDRMRKGQMRRQEAEYRFQRIEALKRTLKWMQDNEKTLKLLAQLSKPEYTDILGDLLDMLERDKQKALGAEGAPPASD